MIVVSWLEPSNGYSEITSYTIKLRQSDEITYTEAAECDGTEALIVSQRQCSIPITTLRAAPYSLEWGTIVYAQVSATNIKGASTASNAGSGAGGVIADAPDIPISFQSTALTSASVIGLSWSPGPTFYGLPVLDYALSYDNGLGDNS